VPRINIIDILRVLEDFEYITIGGIATILYGIGKSTSDLDIILPYYELDRLLVELKKLGFTLVKTNYGTFPIEQISSDEIIECLGATFYGDEQLDIIVHDESLMSCWKILYSRRVCTTSKDLNVKVSLINLNDLINSYEISRRVKDLPSLIELKKLRDLIRSKKRRE
jgi:hypothetical protein